MSTRTYCLKTQLVYHLDALIKRHERNDPYHWWADERFPDLSAVETAWTRLEGGLNPGNSAIAIPQGAIFKRGFRRFIRLLSNTIVDRRLFLENNFCRRGCVPPVPRTCAPRSTRQDGSTLSPSYKSALVEARDFSGNPASWSFCSLVSWPIRNQMITSNVYKCIYGRNSNSTNSIAISWFN